MEEKTTQHEKTEKTILLISFTAGLLMAIAELIFAVYSHSQSSLMDAVYDGVELIFIALILFLTPLFHKPISEKRPYGFFQIESIFLLIKGFMMLSVTLSVSMGIIESALNRETLPVSTGLPPFRADSMMPMDTLRVTDSIMNPLMRRKMDSIWKKP